VKDSQGNLVLGRTRWRRFAAVLIPATLLGVGLMAGVAQGLVPVQINVSGQTFKVSADSLESDNFAQYGGIVTTKNGTVIPVLISAIDGPATLKNLCQSVKSPLGPTMVIRAGRGSSAVTATHLLIGMDRLGGDATFTNIDIGQDASTVPTFKKGEAGDFAQQATHVSIANLKQRAYITSAGSFALQGLSLKLSLTGEECFPDSELPS
jgi:hypothetical protein